MPQQALAEVRQGIGGLGHGYAGRDGRSEAHGRRLPGQCDCGMTAAIIAYRSAFASRAKTRTWLATGRSRPTMPVWMVRLTMRGAPSTPSTASVVEPPPSRLIASRAPMPLRYSASVGRPTPALSGCLPSTVTSELIERGFLLQGERISRGRRGQPSPLLSINPDRMYMLGVSIMADAVSVILLDFAGGVLGQRFMQPEPMTRAVVLDCVEALKTCQLGAPFQSFRQLRDETESRRNING